ncbi:unnamed protein product [Mytilus edulis]|uniref:Uncharacterized protein n=1 Tax=Mytilus edulis TaxID=6550 RepID=A0A8S3U3W1_MYTED|nr:unnamed protein product [Mytilus edulis]
MQYKRKNWMSDNTWVKVEERRKAKEKVLNAITRQQKRQTQDLYREIDKEVKKNCKQDKRDYVEQLAQEAEIACSKGDIKSLYNTTKQLSGRRSNSSATCNQNIVGQMKISNPEKKSLNASFILKPVRVQKVSRLEHQNCDLNSTKSILSYGSELERFDSCINKNIMCLNRKPPSHNRKPPYNRKPPSIIVKPPSYNRATIVQ